MDNTADTGPDTMGALTATTITGLGMSGGEFANTNFSSNTDDVLAAANWLREAHRAPQVVIGHSLGGAVAIDLAANLAGDATGAKGLIVESSFTSLSEVVSEMGYGWVPARILLTQKFDSIEKIRQIRIPVLIVHGADDRYVPPRLSEALYAAAPPPKKLLLLKQLQTKRLPLKKLRLLKLLPKKHLLQKKHQLQNNFKLI